MEGGFMHRVLRLAVVVPLVLCPAIVAQQTPNATPGFRSEGVYDFANVDEVSLFNGQLTLRLPIGQRLPVNGGLGYQLLLSYSSSAWEAWAQSCTESDPPEEGKPTGGDPPEVPTVGCADLYPKPVSNAGLGFRVSLGALFHPAHGNPFVTSRWIYSDPSGAEHALYPRLHPDDVQDTGDPANEPTDRFETVMYTRDGSFARVQCPQLLNGNCTVELPNGDQHVFVNYGDATIPDYRLTQMLDRFGNWIFVSYPDSFTWQITDSEGERTTTVKFFEPASYSEDQPRLVDWIDVPCFEGSCPGGGSHARWNFGYEFKNIWPPAIYGQNPIQRNVWLLTSLTLPDGTTYTWPKVDYDADQGGLGKLILPTQGSITWSWATFQFPAMRTEEHCDPETNPWAEYWTAVRGVVERHELDLGGGALGTWKYWREADVQEPQVPEKLTVAVQSPLDDISLHYFSLWPGDTFCLVGPEHGTGVWEYAMPYTRFVSDPVNDGVQRYLSSQVFDCPLGTNLADPFDPEPTCTRLREVYQAWLIDDPDGSLAWRNGDVADRNRRLLSERTVYLDDGSRSKTRTMSNFDGLGHFRQTLAKGDFVAGHDRTLFTGFNPTRGEYTGLEGDTYVQVGLGDAWILETFDSRSTSETSIVNLGGGTSTQTASEELCFEPSTGFLLRQRRFSASGGNRSANDVLLVRTHDSQGNLASETWYGGDGQALGTGSAVCSLGLPGSNLYHVEHVLSEDVDGSGYDTRTSQWRDASGQPPPIGDPLNFFSSDVTIDRISGLVKSSRDVSGLQTTYDYDALGRLTLISPSAASEAACESYAYTAAASPNLAKVNHQALPNADGGACGGTALLEEQWQYEGFGRLRREQRRATDGQFNDRFTWYDGAGNRSYLSEWWRGETTGAYGVEWAEFDPFGRPGKVQRYSNNLPLTEPEALISYLGERKVTRTQWIATYESGGVPQQEEVERVEWFDDHGRLRSVNEHSAGATAIWTDYEYDAGNRLRRARTPTSTGGNQDRWWLYDQRGFLAQERSPEKGTSGNGDVLFASYDPLGNAGSRTDGGTQVTFAFDRAGRLLNAKEPAASNRLLKAFTYADANSGTDYRKGKLATATGYNWVSVPPTNFDARLVEAFEYRGTAGRRSMRSVSFYLGPVGPDPVLREVFTHAEGFDALGQRTSLVYPECTFETLNCPVAQPHRTVGAGYNRGFLTAVTDTGFHWLSSMTYHYSGLWNTLNLGNGIQEVQTHDTLRIPRPAQLEAKQGGSTLWKTGIMYYDRTGNLGWVVGNEEGGTEIYLYDQVSRLKEAREHVPSDLGNLLFADGFESGSEARWGQTWPPAGWSPGMHTELFAYDRFGNLLDTDGAPINQYPTSETSNHLTAGTYDARGNLTSYAGWTHSFDALNRQWKRQAPDTSAEYYLYTADDERILTYAPSADPAAFRWTLRDFGAKVLRLYVSTNVPEPQVVARRDYAFAGERLVGTEDPQNPSTSRMYATVDHLGTPRLWTDTSGQVLKKLKYYPYGKEATPSDQGPIALQFTGHERDANDLTQAGEDIDYMHARNELPGMGRFLSIDPVGGSGPRPQTWNRYSYVTSNPLNYVDPAGLVRKRAPGEVVVDEPCTGVWDCIKKFLTRIANSDPSGVSGVVNPISASAGIAKTAAGVVPVIRSLVSRGPGVSGRGGVLHKAFRYVGAEEAALIRATGRVPNFTRAGSQKPVYLSPQEFASASEAEKALGLGRFDPRGPIPGPTHRVTVDLEGVQLSYAGNSATGPAGIELQTLDSPIALEIMELEP